MELSDYSNSSDSLDDNLSSQDEFGSRALAPTGDSVSNRSPPVATSYNLDVSGGNFCPAQLHHPAEMGAPTTTLAKPLTVGSNTPATYPATYPATTTSIFHGNGVVRSVGLRAVSSLVV